MGFLPLISPLQTHVCIQQTALELIGRGLEVHIVADATSSRSMMDRMFALEVSFLVKAFSIWGLWVNFPAYCDLIMNF